MKILVNEKISQHKYKTPEGYLICVDSVLARTGNQTYRKNELFVDSEDDSEIEVGRSPEEVFSAETLASFENKPITIEHPDEDVNIENYKDYSVGFVRDVKQGKFDGQDVILGTLVITDKDAIEGIENGEHVELSCGYDCDIEDGADGYQQKHIRGNHVALCEAGRAGIAKIVDSVDVKDVDNKIAKVRIEYDRHQKIWCGCALNASGDVISKYIYGPTKQDVKEDAQQWKIGQVTTEVYDSVKDEDTVKYKGYTLKLHKGYNVWLNMKDYYEVFDERGNKVAMKKDLKSAKEYVDNGGFKDAVGDAKKYAVEFTYEGDSISDYLGHVWVYANSDKEALKKAEQWATNEYEYAGHFKIVPKAYSNSPVIDAVGDAVLPEAKGQYKGYEVIAKHVGYKNAPTEVDIFDGKRKVKSYFTSEEDLTGAIREIYKFWPEPPLTKENRKYIENYLSMISGFVRRKDTDIQDILRPLYGKGFKPIVEKVEGWIWKKDAYAYKNYYIELDGYADKFLVTLYADPAQDWDTKEVNAYFTDSVKDEKLYTVAYNASITANGVKTKEFDNYDSALSFAKKMYQNSRNHTVIIYEGDFYHGKEIWRKSKLGAGDSVKDAVRLIEKYKGYEIWDGQANNGEVTQVVVKKNGKFIQSADNVDEAKKDIDDLTKIRKYKFTYLVEYSDGTTGEVSEEFGATEDTAKDKACEILAKNKLPRGRWIRLINLETNKEIKDSTPEEEQTTMLEKDLKHFEDVDPRSGESKDDFIARFMKETKNEYPDEKQRLAVAYSYWERKGRDSMVKDMTKLDVIKENKANYEKVSRKLNSMSGLQKLVAQYLILPWLSGHNWLGGLSDAQGNKAYAKIASMGYDYKDIEKEEQRQQDEIYRLKDSKPKDSKVKDADVKYVIYKELDADDRNDMRRLYHLTVERIVKGRNQTVVSGTRQHIEEMLEENGYKGHYVEDSMVKDAKLEHYYNSDTNKHDLNTENAYWKKRANGLKFKVEEGDKYDEWKVTLTGDRKKLERLAIDLGYEKEDLSEYITDSMVKDAKQTFEIRWIDQYQKSKGYDKSFWLNVDTIKADTATEALEKLKNIAVMRGTGTRYVTIVNIKSNTSNYQLSGNVDEVIRRLNDSKPKDSIYSLTIQGQKSKKLVRAKDAREAIDKYTKMFPKDKIKSVKKTDKFNNIIETITR